MCAVTVVKTGQETRPEQLKGDCQVLLTFYSIFLDVNYDSNNILLVEKKKKQFLASCGGGSEEVLNYILSWKYTSCHLSLDVRVFHLAWKFKLIGNLFLKKKNHMSGTLMCCAYFCSGISGSSDHSWEMQVEFSFPLTDLGMVLDCPGN